LALNKAATLQNLELELMDRRLRSINKAIKQDQVKSSSQSRAEMVTKADSVLSNKSN